MTISSRVILGWPFWSDPVPLFPTALSGGSWLAALPLTNLQDRRLALVARSTDAAIASTKLIADLKTPRSVRVVSIPKHTMTLAPPLVATWPSVGDAAWAANGTPTRAPGAATVGGIPLDLIGDDDGAAAEGYQRVIPGLVGNGSRIVVFKVKQGSAAVVRVDVTGAGANVSQATFTWTNGVPVGATSVAGTYGVTILSVTALTDGGYAIVVRFDYLIGGDTNTLRFWPAGTTAASTGASYLGDVRIWDLAVPAKARVRGFSAQPIIDWLTVGDGSWTAIGTPVRVAAATTVNGIPLDYIGDDDGAVNEQTHRLVAFTGNGQKVVSFLVRRFSAYASHQFQLNDETAAALRLSVQIDFTTTTPAVTILAGHGTVLSVVAVDTGWRITVLTDSVTAANTNHIYVKPAAAANADQAALFVGDIQAWNAEEPSLIYDGGNQEVSPDIYPTTAPPSWTPPYGLQRIAPDDAVGYPMGFIHVVPNDAAAVAQYWYLDITDASNAAGYIDLSRLVIAAGYQPTLNPKFGATVGWESDTVRTKTEGAAAVYTDRPRRRDMILSWDGLPTDEALVNLHEILRRLGTSGQVMVILDSTIVAHVHRWSFLAVPRELSPLGFPNYQRNSAAFSFLEEL